MQIVEIMLGASPVPGAALAPVAGAALPPEAFAEVFAGSEALAASQVPADGPATLALPDPASIIAQTMMDPGSSAAPDLPAIIPLPPGVAAVPPLVQPMPPDGRVETGPQGVAQTPPAPADASGPQRTEAVVPPTVASPSPVLGSEIPVPEATRAAPPATVALALPPVPSSDLPPAAPLAAAPAPGAPEGAAPDPLVARQDAARQAAAQPSPPATTPAAPPDKTKVLQAAEPPPAASGPSAPPSKEALPAAAAAPGAASAAAPPAAAAGAAMVVTVRPAPPPAAPRTAAADPATTTPPPAPQTAAPAGTMAAAPTASGALPALTASLPRDRRTQVEGATEEARHVPPAPATPPQGEVTTAERREDAGVPRLPEPAAAAAADRPPPTETAETPLRLVETEPGRAQDPASPRGPDTGTAPQRTDQARGVAEQLSGAIRAASDGTVELQLSPEELGRVRLTLHMAEGAVTLNVAADRPETLDLIRKNVDLLARDLREQGFGSLNLSFGQDAPRGGGTPYATAATHPLATSEGETPAGQTLPRAQSRPTSGLDLRL